MAAQAGLVGSEIDRGRIMPRDWAMIDAGAAVLSRLPLDVIDTTPVTILSLRTWIRRAVSHYGRLGLVIIDYLQLMSGRKRAENRQVEVAEMSRDLKLMAGELEVPVVVLCQLSRGLETRADKRPTLIDLRESGAPENDADLVIGIFRDEMYNPDSPDRGIAELGVIKNRFGPQGVARLHADLPRHRWADLTSREAI
jgi:replicative DNA helicase